MSASPTITDVTQLKPPADYKFQDVNLDFIVKGISAGNIEMTTLFCPPKFNPEKQRWWSWCFPGKDTLAYVSNKYDKSKTYKEQDEQFHPDQNNKVLFNNISNDPQFMQNYTKIMTTMNNILDSAWDSKDNETQKQYLKSHIVAQMINCVYRIAQELILTNDFVKRYLQNANESKKYANDPQIQFYKEYELLIKEFNRILTNPGIEIKTPEEKFYTSVRQLRASGMPYIINLLLKNMNKQQQDFQNKQTPISEQLWPSKPDATKKDGTGPKPKNIDDSGGDSGETPPPPPQPGNKDDNDDNPVPPPKKDEPKKNHNDDKKKKEKKRETYMPDYSSILHGSKGTETEQMQTPENEPIDNSATLNIKNFYKKKPYQRHPQSETQISKQNTPTTQDTENETDEELQDNENNSKNKNENKEDQRPEIKWWMWLLCVLIIGIFIVLSVKKQQNKYDEEHKDVKNNSKNTNLESQKKKGTEKQQ